MMIVLLLFILFALPDSTAAATPAEILKCYNEIQAPNNPSGFFGVPVVAAEDPVSGRRVTDNLYSAPRSTSAYIVTSKTILKQTFDYDNAEDLGRRPNPNGGGQVQVSASPIFELTPKQTGLSNKIFLRAKWTKTVDHPNGANLSVVELQSSEVRREQGKVVALKPQTSLTPEAQSAVLMYLKSHIESSLWDKRGSSVAYDTCHRIPDLKEFMESKMSSFETSPVKSGVAPIGNKPVSPKTGR